VISEDHLLRLIDLTLADKRVITCVAKTGGAALASTPRTVSPVGGPGLGSRVPASGCPRGTPGRPIDHGADDRGPPVVRSFISLSALSLRWALMTDNTTNKGGADTETGSALIAFESPDEEADLPEELPEIDDDDSGGDDDDSGGDSVLGTGAVSGGFGFAGLALAVVSLTTN